MKRALLACFLTVALALGTSAFAAGPDASMLRASRAKHITPRIHPPKNVDWARIQNACTFANAHAQTISATLGTTSLVSTFACRDIAPVLVYTGRLTDDYGKRIQETGAWIDEIRKTPHSKAEFVSRNYKRAYELGVLHHDLSEAIKPNKLGWNANERVAMNQQAVAFVLYCFAWEPIENMEALHEIDAVKDAKGISDYLYFWNVVGYAMGVNEKLLPKDAKQSLALMTDLRNLQYYKPGEKPTPVDTIIKNWMDSLYPVLLQGKTINDQTKARARAILAQQIAVSPGLSQALGFGNKTLDALNKIAHS